MNLDALLSPHFTLRELVRTAHRTIDNTPSSEDVYRLTKLCNWVLEPLRVQFGRLYVDSGYRGPTLNTLIGGVATSAHLYGCAADVAPMDGASIGQMMVWLSTSGLPFDQAIDEMNTNGDAWLHVGTLTPQMLVGNPRRELLEMRVVNGKKTYSQWVLG